ncbi:hypothetical protein TNCV_1352511 [Trichonephila clavipes]|nr:hypothetical protein TNCV_1352511 [Trichonephila clavipes]
MFLPTLLRIIEDASQTDIAEKDEEGNSIDQDEPDIGGQITPQSSEIMKPPEQPKKKKKKKSDSIPDKEIAQAIQKLDEIANKSTEDKPYDLFGRYVASEMRQLPNRAAILLQQEIQNCITRYNARVGDLVLIKEDNLAVNKWLMGRLIEVFPGKDNRIRVVTIKTQHGVVKRPISKILSAEYSTDSFSNVCDAPYSVLPTHGFTHTLPLPFRVLSSIGTATAGSDVVQSGRPIFDDFFQHLWPYIGNNTANVVFQMVKRL